MEQRDNVISPGAIVVPLGAIVLIVSLFLDWYEVHDFASISAWSTFEVVDLMLAGGALLAAYLSIPPGLGIPGSAERERGAHLLLPLTLLLLVLVAANLISQPPAARGAGIEIGGWLALVAVLVMAAGAFLTRSRISLTVSVSPREPASSEAPTEVSRTT